MGGATIQFASRSVTFIPDDNKKHMLNKICDGVKKEDMIIDARLNNDDLYSANASYLSKTHVAVFSRIQ